MEEKSTHDFDDDITMESSAESLNWQFQKEHGADKLLPYAEELDDDARTLLAEIKGQLGRATMLRRLKPDCVLWTWKLRRYMKVYSLKFSKEDHIAFVKLIYELVTIPNLEPHLVDVFGKTLYKLLEKTKLISPDELELQWKPLYDLAKRVIYIGHSSRGMYRVAASIKLTLRMMILRANVYFPATATREILEELRPTLCPLEGGPMFHTVELLEWFLPVQLLPANHHRGFELWFDELMKLWEVCDNAPLWDKPMMSLMARLAWHNVGYVDWEPHVPLMFTRFVSCFNLPVYYKHLHGGPSRNIETHSMALWIVAALGAGSTSETYMKTFLETIETYLHQANFGPWGPKLKDMLNKLVILFVERLHNERYEKGHWHAPVPDTHKLTDSDVDAFVKSVIPVAMTAMFSKMARPDGCDALRHLANIRPNLVIPDILERMYSTLDSLTEPHKLTAVMAGMSAVARPMVQGSRNINKGYEYAEGPSHVVPLLFSVLPGIDANDPTKCFSTCTLIGIYATLVPIVDTSRSTAPMDEDDRLVSESTSRFEDFVLQFFDRIFSLIESSTLEFLSHENATAGGGAVAGCGKSKLETMAESAVGSTCAILLSQSSDEIFRSALRKFRSFVTERVLETTVSGQLAAAVCRSFARANGRETLRILVPGLAETILGAIGDGDEVFKEEHLDKHLLYAMLMLAAVVETQGEHLMGHHDTLTRVLDKILRLKCREGIEIASLTLFSVVYGLSTPAPVTARSNGRDYNDPEYPYLNDWGQSTAIANFQIGWYVPGDNELGVVQNIFSRYVAPEIAKIEQYIAKTVSMTRAELLTSLSIIASVFEGCEELLPVSTDPLADDDDDDPSTAAPTSSFLPKCGINGEIRMPDGESNVRRYMCKLMSQLQRVMLSDSEDDTKSLFGLMRIWNSLLLGNARAYDTYEARCRNFKMVKELLKDKLVKRKNHFGGAYILQFAELHESRRANTRYHRFTQDHKLIYLQLLELATSRYANVRARAQEVLVRGFSYFPLSHTVVGPRLLEILASDPDDNHEAHKGVLYLLLTRSRSEPLITVQDWAFLRTLWPAIILSKPSEKLSVIRLKESLVDTVHRNFPTTTIAIDVPDSCVATATALWNYSPRPGVSQPSEDELRRGIVALEKLGRTNGELYDGLVDNLLRAILEENPHWRHRSMAMRFIRDLVHPDRKYPVNVVRYFLNALIHESLDERKIALETVSFMLTQQKRKHLKIEADLSKLRMKEHARLSSDGGGGDGGYPGVRLDNVWLQYNYATRPQSEAQWNEPRYVHNPCVGYYAWPTKLEIYAPSEQQPDLEPATRVLTFHESEVDRFFGDADNIDKLVKYHSLEERKGKDKFNKIRAQLFKGLFRNHGNVHLKNFLPHLRRLVAEKNESSQRCAAEITSGLVRGTKHWPFDMVNDTWRQLTPIIRTALNNLTMETSVDWAMCVTYAQDRRDTNRQHWLLECLMEEPPLGDSTTSVVECGRFYVLQVALCRPLWRLIEPMERLLARVQGRLLANPFENVRARLAALLSVVYAGDLPFPRAVDNDRLTPRCRDLMNKVMPQLRQLLSDEGNSNGLLLLSRVAEVRLSQGQESSGSSSSGSGSSSSNEQTVRLFKTICRWVISSSANRLTGSRAEFYELFPIACQLENSESDQELAKICSGTLAVLAQAPTLPADMGAALESVENVSRGASWSARAACLSFLETFVFYNMSIVLSRPEWVDRVKDIVLKLLEDERLEVREKARQVLGGLLHCTFIRQQELLLDEFKSKSKRQLKQHDDLRLRHAGVLGLCAFILAHPYDVPKCVPPIFEHLGLHLNDPQPIPTTIRKTLGDFKRTHYDDWATHALRFTEEQLTILRDLTVPPSYYA